MEQHCTLLINLKDVKSAATQIEEIKNLLEKGDDGEKVEALKMAILLIISGEDMGSLMMTIIRYCLHTTDKELKKIIHLYWEAVPKYGSDGNLRSEVILACNALRKDLIHPNEYICGNTLRFLCKLHEPALLQPLVPSITEALNHKSAYVRANAVVTTYIIFKNFPDLIENAPDLLEDMLSNEKDYQARRNAFLMLFYAKPSAAVYYLMENIEDLEDCGSGFQLAVLEVARKVSRSDPTQKPKFIQVIFELLQSEEPVVMYEAAVSLVALSSSATAVRASAQCLCRLLTSHSDNNVKLIVIDQLNMLKKRHRRVLQELVIDIMRSLAIPNLDIRKRALAIATDLLSPQNIESVMLKLKKELLSQAGRTEDGSAEYRTQLVHAIYSCAEKFPPVAGTVVRVLVEHLGGGGSDGTAVAHFVRDILETYPKLRAEIIEKVIEMLPLFKEVSVLEVVFWILGEYCETTASISRAFEAVQSTLGPLPLTTKPSSSSSVEDDAADTKDETKKSSAEKTRSRPVVLADGTYASQSAVIDTKNGDDGDSSESDGDDFRLRHALLDKSSDFYLANSMCSALIKMVLRVVANRGDTDAAAKAMSVEVLLIVCSIVEVGHRRGKISGTTAERLRFCIHSVLDPVIRKNMSILWLRECRASFGDLLKERSSKAAAATKEASDEEKQRISPDHLITFRHLCGSKQLNHAIDLDDDFDLGSATNIGSAKNVSRLDRMHQLTGFGDPVYVEAMITVHDYDIVMDITIVNRTQSTLKNLTVELATMGDLKLVERPQNYTILPGGSQEVKASIKVSSTETGHVFGTVVYDVYEDGSVSDARRQVIVNLKDVHIDIMDYIRSATCSDKLFRQMWAEFEWENKVAVNTNIQDLETFLKHVLSITNMNCLTPWSTVSGSCDFLAANLYARSVFGEDALLNLSVEKRTEASGDVKLVGYMRIRSKTQGIALSLGDRIQAKQRKDEKD
eukprot:g459.t1